MVMWWTRCAVLIMLMLPASGCLYVWGADAGSVVGSTGDRSTPTLVGDDVWTDVSSDWAHACGIRSGGALLCWGSNPLGLGQPLGATGEPPYPVGSETDWTAVSVGAYHSCGIRGGGELWCWGGNWFGQLGEPTSFAELTPVRVGTAGDWTAVDSGNESTCGIRAAGELFCWGVNRSGNIGQPATVFSIDVPTKVGDETGWTDVDAASDRTCGVRAGRLLCWGYPIDDPWPDPLPPDTHLPTPVDAGADWATVSVDVNACATTVTGVLACWGASDRGTLGTGSMEASSATPMPVLAPGVHFTSVDTRAASTCGTTDGGELWCWGANDRGQLGDGTTADSATPGRIGTQAGWSAIELGTDGLTYGVRI